MRETEFFLTYGAASTAIPRYCRVRNLPIGKKTRFKMERRSVSRPPVAFQVEVTEVARPQNSAIGETLDLSQAGIAVFLPIQFTRGTLVEIRMADSVLRGFVAYSRPWPQVHEASFARNKSWVGMSEESAPESRDRAFYRTGIELAEVSIGTSGLSQLLKTTFEETTYAGQV